MTNAPPTSSSSFFLDERELCALIGESGAGSVIGASGAEDAGLGLGGGEN